MGEELRLPPDDFDRNPATLDLLWRKYFEGVYQPRKGLLVVLNGKILLDYGKSATV